MNKYWADSLDNKKISFVCSGGVTKAAAWHVGVSLALEDMGLKFQHHETPDVELTRAPHVTTYVGSSAGSLVCLWLSMGHGPHEVLRSFLDSKETSLAPITYRDMLSFKKTAQILSKRARSYEMFEHFPYILRKLISPITKFNGFFSTVGLGEYLKHNVIKVNSFSDLKPDVFIVATHLDHSQKVVFGKYNYPSPKYDDSVRYITDVSIVDAACASMSVPPFYSPYPIKSPSWKETEYFIDGEIRETLSTHVAIDNKSDVIFSSWTHTPYHLHQDIGSLANYGLPTICIQSILLMIQKKITSSRKRIQMKKVAIDSVHEYMSNQNFEKKHIQNIIEILETKLDYRKNIKMIDIYPTHDNYDLFFSSSFSLNTETTYKIVRMAYRRTIQIVKETSW